MSSSQPLGGASQAGRLLGPYLDRIIKNAAWRKHSTLVSSCKSVLVLLESLRDSPPDPTSPVAGLSAADADIALSPLILALDTASLKVAEPALDAAHRLFSLSLVRTEISDVSASGESAPVTARLIASVCSCGAIGEESLELAMLRVLVAAVRSTAVVLRGECLVQIVKSCYNVYLGSQSPVNQLCAKTALVQILMIVFTRVEADAADVAIKTALMADVLDLADKNLNDSNLVQAARNFINEAMGVDELEVSEGKLRQGEVGEADAGGMSKIREDGFFLFKNLCKFSMKFAAPGENPEDPLLLRGKVLSLELLKMVMENAGTFWLVNERFLGAIKQYLCLSLLKNSALSVMSIFQLLCSIFMILLFKFRSGLKGEIGIFFPMLVLRVLENVLQPSFLQKMTVLNFVEKMCQDPQLIIDIFVNYDCDVDAPNIFERIVNGLLKTALGVPAGSSTTLSPAQDSTFQTESVKCLATFVKCMATWMDQQLIIKDFSPRSSDMDHSTDNSSVVNVEEGASMDFDLHTDTNFVFSDAASLEQRRAYKIEFQKGISLFNRKPSKGIEFLINTKKIGGSPEEVASFLRSATGLNATMIGDFLGERDEFPLKVMHAYVDSLNFEGMDFGEAIRFLLRGFRLPGEAQKIDRIMEKFAQRYCKCNPSAFTSADTAYVLAYSVIMLNTDAHNTMVKDKMSESDFIRNNRGIDDGKDLPEDYLGSLYDQIVKNEIKMNADNSAPQKQASSMNKLLGLDNILSLVNWKQKEEKALGANDMLIKHIQEQFKEKSGKLESMFYSITDTAILRYMTEVCWAPMLAAFSVILDQSDDKVATSQSLLGFRYSVHVTSFMFMHTQRDAFVTSVAKFTYLHCAADMKQKNVDAVKAIMSIAIEDGNYLQEAWEHVLTCLSRFEHLLLLGEGAPPDASFFSAPLPDLDDKSQKSHLATNLKKKVNALQNPAVMAVVRGGSYDSATVGSNSAGLVSSEQINNFISNIHLLDQIGSFELNHIFAHSQRLNGDAIVAFVRALCKVSMAELQSPTDPRVFSLTKLVEIAHYNMDRIRLVWSHIWSVLSDFFVSVGLSENLSVVFFIMDSLRQLAMKFLEREELANYNFQNEFLRPFVVIMQKSTASETRELIVRCISQMVLSRVSNVKSGWKSVFTIFTIAAADERKNIVLLAFGTMEKIVRDYFRYITETETTTFTDCVKCLITFTTSRFNYDASLNAIVFLRFCAVKLAEGGLVCYDENDECNHANGDPPDSNNSKCKDNHIYFWVPLLAGLSKLTSDPRTTIRKAALEVLFHIVKDHGHLFSSAFLINIFKSAIYPILKEPQIHDDYQVTSEDYYEQLVEEPSNADIRAVAAGCLVDLFVAFFEVLRSQFMQVVEILSSYIRSPYRQSSSTGVACLLQLTEKLGRNLSETEWRQILLALHNSAASSFPVAKQAFEAMNKIEIPSRFQSYSNTGDCSDQESVIDDEEDADMEKASYAIVKLKDHIAVLFSIIEAIQKLYEAHQKAFSSAQVTIVLSILSSIASHSSELNSHTTLLQKLERLCSLLEMPEPPAVHFENECHQNYLKLLKRMLGDNVPVPEEICLVSLIASESQKMLSIYLTCAGYDSEQQSTDKELIRLQRIIPLVSSKREELAARTPLVVCAIKALSELDGDAFRRNLKPIFPLLVDLLRCEHGSREVLLALSDIFQSSIGQVIFTM